jgi:carboxyl-terminal processing protease
MNRSTGLTLALFLAFSAGYLIDRSIRPANAPTGLGKPFAEAWQLAERYYVDRPAVVPARMTEGAIRGMLGSLGDTGHTSYLTKEQFLQFTRSIEGHFDGIGARFTIRKNDLVIVETFPDSPARRAGLLPGDVLLQVDDKRVREIPIQKVAELIRGPAGTTVHLRVRRAGDAAPLDLNVRREKVSFPDITWSLLPGVSIAHIAILEFGAKADSELRKAVQAAAAQGAKALLIDVRGNPGGLKDQAVAVTSEFLDAGNVFLERDAQGKQTAVPVRAGGVAPRIPLCVLIDNGTASSAEIFAGAIQDHARGKLVGTRTFGTGTVLRPFPLSDGSVVLLAVEEWLTPKGRQIWHTGISPDVEVTLLEDATVLLPGEESKLDAAALAASTDRQLLKAVELLSGKQNRRRAKDG